MEFQVVLLAGSQGNRLYPLCEETPPCLLTVATRPLLHYQLDHLLHSGFLECIIVTRSQFVRAISTTVDQWKATKHGHITSTVSGGLRDDKRLAGTSPTSSTSSSASSSSPTFHVQIEHLDGWTGTCSALRHVRHLLHTDFFCIQSDIITTVPLHHLADIHRSRDASVTALLLEPRPAPPNPTKKKKDEEEDDHDTHYIGLIDEQSTLQLSPLQPSLPTSTIPSSRLLYYKSSLDLDEPVLTLHKPLLRRCQQLTLHSSLKDAHLYLFAHWILNLLHHKPLMMSVQADLVPYLVKSQHSPALLPYLSTRQIDDDQTLITSMSHSPPRRDPDETYRCYVLISPSYCRRVTSVRQYRDINTELALSDEDELLSLVSTENHAQVLMKQHVRAQLAQSFCAGNVALSSDQPVTVRRTVVGRGVRVGGGVKVNGSIVMEGCVIEDGVVLTDSVISEGSTIGKGSTVINCKVGPRYHIPPNSEHKNEVLCHERST